MNILHKMNPIRQLAAAILLIMLVLPLSAQEKADSVVTFRFFSGKDMFFSPGLNNGEELARLFDCVERYKDKITGHKILLNVDGYCSSKKSEAENRAVARIRSNRVKSELITRKGLTEDCFSTRNHTDKGDFVTVRIFIPKEEITSPATEDKAEEPSVDVVTEPEPECEVVEPDTLVNVDASEPPAQVEQTPMPEVVTPGDVSMSRPDSNFALKTNLLGYAVLMPNIEAEWMFARRWSVALEVQGAWYSKSSPRRVYRLSTVTPEVRFWAIDRSKWHGMYVGVFGGGGLYDLSNSKKGHEGEGFMVGASVGYMWPIAKHLSLDAGLGLGYMHSRDKEYTPLDGHFLYQLTKNINYFGPLRLKLSLVWRIPSCKKQSAR